MDRRWNAILLIQIIVLFLAVSFFVRFFVKCEKDTQRKRDRLSETEIELRLLNCLHYYYLTNIIQCTLSSIVEYIHAHAHIHTTQFLSEIKFQLMFTRCDDDIHLFFAHHLMNYKLYKFGWLFFYLHYLIYVIILEQKLMQHIKGTSQPDLALLNKQRNGY